MKVWFRCLTSTHHKINIPLEDTPKKTYSTHLLNVNFQGRYFTTSPFFFGGGSGVQYCFSRHPTHALSNHQHTLGESSRLHASRAWRRRVQKSTWWKMPWTPNVGWMSIVRPSPLTYLGVGPAVILVNTGGNSGIHGTKIQNDFRRFG